MTAGAFAGLVLAALAAGAFQLARAQQDGGSSASPASAAGQRPGSTQKPVDFNREVRPILSDNCFFCHGPDEKTRMVGVRLDTPEGALAVRGKERIVTPGNPSASRLYLRISASKPALRMPPPHSGKQLSARQVDVIRRWIEEGAAWQEHWSFVPPRRQAPPEVKDASWPRNGIDHFVLSRLEQEGLRPSAEADKAALLRRVSLDLTGLPPTLEQLRSFLSDASPHAYENQVDRLLNSPHYGERMAMEWLDAARYADTHGFHIDSHRDMWPWRDWVIRAFSSNMPYDRFVVEQLAGDLLPAATREQLVATGFSRNHMINYEGGAIPEEYLAEYVVDRVEAASTAFLGLTMGCARCHDHKYDPLRQKDFYQFYAFFHNVPEKGLDGRRGNADPFLPLPTPEQESLRARLAGFVADLKYELEAPGLTAALRRWESSRAASLPQPPDDALLARYEFEENLSESSGHSPAGRKVRGELPFPMGVNGKSASLGGETHIDLGGPAAFDGSAPFSIALWTRSGITRPVTALQNTSGGAARRGIEIHYGETLPLPKLRKGSYLYIRLVHSWPENAIEVRTRQRVLRGPWVHLALNYDGSGRAAGVEVYVDGAKQPLEVLRDSLSGSMAGGRWQIGDKTLGAPYTGQLDELRFHGRLLQASEVEALAVHQPVHALLSGALLSGRNGKLNREQRETLRRYYLERDAAPMWRLLYSRQSALEEELEALDAAIPTTMVMREMETPRDTHILLRGDYRNLGEKVAPATPAALPPMPAGAPANRLGLAQWLVAPKHPLTARVAVNRFWQMIFGTGLVKTSEDFGSQGKAPSHPELLDWLATEFVRLKWDVKALNRMIVLSATYRQSSRATPELIERDPENRLLARGARFRLPAELVRDNALAVSGLLNPEIGGPGVNPYQPDGVWEEVAYGDIYSSQFYTPDRGKALYRRGMYTFWKRTAPPPALISFDAPDREKCIVRRARTNTPLQALVLMNDPTYVEAARALAARLLARGPQEAGERVRRAFLLVLAREPSTAESQVLRDLLEAQAAAFRRDPEKAASLLEVGELKAPPGADPPELAAWTMLAHAILNLDETITKE